MKMLSAIAALMLGTTAALAGPLGLPDHQPDGFRDTGCDAAAQTPIKNEAGEILYWNNSTCPGVGGGASPFFTVGDVDFPTDEEPGDEEPPVEVVSLD